MEINTKWMIEARNWVTHPKETKETCLNYQQPRSQPSSLMTSLLDFSKVFISAFRGCDIEEAFRPGIVVGASDRSSHNWRQNHGPETSGAFVDGPCSASVKRILHHSIEMIVFKLFLEDKIDKLSCSNVQENCGCCIVCETWRCLADIVKISVYKNTSGSPCFWGWYHCKSIETAAEEGENVRRSH